MSDADADFRAVFDSLVTERGGRSVFSVSQLAACRRVAQLLCNDTAGSSSVAPLLEMLPAVIVGPIPDWSKLSDKEFRLLDHLWQRGLGLKPERRRREKRSLRRFNADHLAFRIDAIVAEGRKPTEDELHEISGDVADLIYPCVMIPVHLWPEAAKEFGRSLAAASPPSAPLPLDELPDEPETAPAAVSVASKGNVVRLDRTPSTPSMQRNGWNFPVN